ncbi:MAG: hypothetical protein AAF541_14660 [Pseudomonadota bacterium]
MQANENIFEEVCLEALEQVAGGSASDYELNPPTALSHLYSDQGPIDDANYGNARMIPFAINV